jgi:hypothetical protein
MKIERKSTGQYYGTQKRKTRDTHTHGHEGRVVSTTSRNKQKKKKKTGRKKKRGEKLNQRALLHAGVSH